MVTLGVVLLIAAALLGVDLVLENSGTTDVMIMGQLLSFDVWGLFVVGVATGVLMVAGVQAARHRPGQGPAEGQDAAADRA